MSLTDLASPATLVSAAALLASLFFLFFQMRRVPGQVAQTENRYPSAPVFQDHLEVIIRVNDWISDGNRGEDVPPRDVFLKMPSKTIDTLVDQLGYFGYSGAVRKLYLKNEARINRVLSCTRPNSEERNTAMNVILADVLVDLARQANISIPGRS